MKEFYVNFSGYLIVKAETEAEADELFYDFMSQGADSFRPHLSGYDWDIENTFIEEINEK